MVKVLQPNQVDVEQEAVDQVMTQAEEAAANAKFATTANPGDLTDGGMVNGARLRPMAAGRTLPEGRAAARRAWSWNGTESLLTLAWNPDGNRHDGARHYLLKRHCLCCRITGFIGRQCPACVKSRCGQCNSSTDRTTPQTLGNGKVIQGWIIPAFYLSQDQVPFPERFYGEIPCFLPLCPRRGLRGFKTDEDMRLHAMSRHRMEYRAHVDTVASRRRDEVDVLRARIDDLMLRLNGNGQHAVIAAPAPPFRPVETASTQVPTAEAEADARADARADRERDRKRLRNEKARANRKAFREARQAAPAAT